MPQSNLKLTSAQSALKSWHAELVAEGFKTTLDSLPLSSEVIIDSQDYVESAHLWRTYVGTEKKQNGDRIWAALGKRRRDANLEERAPAMRFYKDNSKSFGRYEQLGMVNLVEPFRTLWEKMNVTGTSKGAWDESKGLFQSLLYWYHLQRAAERGVDLRLPKEIRNKYIQPALRKLGVLDTRGDRSRLGTEDVASTSGKMPELKKEQEKVEPQLCGGVAWCKDSGTDETTQTKPRRGEVTVDQDEFKGQEEIRTQEERLRELREQQDEQRHTERLSTMPVSLEASEGRTLAGKARIRKRLESSEATGDGKWKRPRIEDDSNGETQFTDDQTSIRDCVEEELLHSTTRRRAVYSHVMKEVGASYSDHAGSDPTEYERSFESSQRPIKRVKASMSAATEAPQPCPLEFNEQRRGHTPLLDPGQRNKDPLLHSISSPPPIASVPKASSPTPHSIPIPSTDEIVEWTPAQYIENMKTALYKTEELNAEITSIEQAEIELGKEMEKLDARRKKAKDALRVNHLANKDIAEGLVRSGKVAKAVEQGA